MIILPNSKNAFEYENNFYLTCENTRIGKALAQYELYKKTQRLPGSIVECGVFKGISLIRFASFREIFSNSASKRIIGFDTFGLFPQTNFEPDKKFRNSFISDAGEKSISSQQLLDVLERKGIDKNIQLIEGDICETVPEFIRMNPNLKISLLNLDTDIYEPAVVILEHLYPRIVKGGYLILDDYGVFPGETKAVDEYFKDTKMKIQKFPFTPTPCFIKKE